MCVTNNDTYNETDNEHIEYHISNDDATSTISKIELSERA